MYKSCAFTNIKSLKGRFKVIFIDFLIKITSFITLVISVAIVIVTLSINKSCYFSKVLILSFFNIFG